MSLFDADAWRGRMDERWFESGAAIAEAGAVDLVAIEDDAVTGHVTGSAGDLYVVTLRAPDGEGACTCPGFDKFGACKHQAAVVVAANTADLSKVRERMARLRDGLALDSREALVERILSMAKNQPDILAKLETGENYSPKAADYSWWNYFLNSSNDHSSTHKIDFSEAETEGLKADVVEKISAVETAISDLQSGGIGHNNPPDDAQDDRPLNDDQLAQIANAAAAIKVEMQNDNPNGIVVANSGRKIREIGQWLLKKLDMAVDEAFKTSGKIVGAAGISLVVGVTAMGGWERLAVSIVALMHALAAWATG